MTYKATNNAVSTLAASINTAATTLNIQAADVLEFPVINNGGVGSDYTMLTLEDASNNIEVVQVTRHDSGASAFTVLRAQEGTTARNWAIGDLVSCRLTAGVVTESFTLVGAHVAQSSGAHAASAISFAPAGNIAATDVQAAVVELDSEAVHKTGDETVGGTKTFSSSPSVPTPTADAHAAQKKYVDDKINVTTWKITESGGNLYFSVSGVNKAKLDTSGNLTVAGDVTAFGTV